MRILNESLSTSSHVPDVGESGIKLYRNKSPCSICACHATNFEYLFMHQPFNGSILSSVNLQIQLPKLIYRNTETNQGTVISVWR
jgi:hypothetical protein